MKTMYLFILCISTISISKAQNTSDLIGTWNIIDYNVTSNGMTDKMGEEALSEEGAVWDLIFMDEHKFTQTSNMRNGTMESWDGTWDMSEDALILRLNVNNRDLELKYSYEWAGKDLILRRSNPNWGVVSTFRRNDLEH